MPDAKPPVAEPAARSEGPPVDATPPRAVELRPHIRMALAARRHGAAPFDGPAISPV